jgi:hypothetical protein
MGYAKTAMMGLIRSQGAGGWELRGRMKKADRRPKFWRMICGRPQRIARYHCTSGINPVHAEPSKARAVPSSHLRDSNPGPQLYELRGLSWLMAGLACDLAGCANPTVAALKSQAIRSPLPHNSAVLSYSLCGVPHVSFTPRREPLNVDADTSFRPPGIRAQSLSSDRKKARYRLTLPSDVRRAGCHVGPARHDRGPDDRRHGSLAGPVRPPAKPRDDHRAPERPAYDLRRSVRGRPIGKATGLEAPQTEATKDPRQAASLAGRGRSAPLVFAGACDPSGGLVQPPAASRDLKTAEAERIVPIPPELRSILVAWMPFAGPEYLLPGVKRKGPWRRAKAGRRPVDELKAACVACGISIGTWQWLRRAWATHAETGWLLPDGAIERVMGHTTPKTARRWYCQTDVDNLAAIGRLITYQT